MPRFEIPEDRLAGRDEVVGQHVPRPRLERAGLQARAQLRFPLGAHHQIIQQGNGLSVEQERLAGEPALEYGIEQSDETLTEARRRVVPLPVPMRMGYHAQVERGHGGALGGWGVHGGETTLRSG